MTEQTANIVMVVLTWVVAVVAVGGLTMSALIVVRLYQWRKQ